MASLNIADVCTAFEATGCCAKESMDIVKALLDLTCLNTPLIGTMFGVASNLCSDLPPTCETFTMPEYDVPTSCPTFSETIENLRDLKGLQDSSYNGCNIQKNTCPKNNCEAFLCTVAE